MHPHQLTPRRRCLTLRRPWHWQRLLPLVAILLAPIAATGQEPATADSVAGPSSTYDRLADPAVASSLKLTDEQQAQVAELLEQRGTALAEADEDQKPAIAEATDHKLADVLTPDQREMFAALFLTRLEFNFRYQKWADVLEWIAEESGLSLVMDAPPAGTFNYSDNKEYTPTEAIDLLNGWLQTKNYALVRRDRLLMLLDLSDGVPPGVIPRVPIEELPTRGRFELVSVLVPLGERPAAGAITEIQPLLGRHGTVEPLAQTKQLLITDTAGNLLAIRALVESLPVPTPAPAPPKPADPVLAAYPIVHANPAQVGVVLTQMLTGKVFVDGTASQVTVNAVPAEQAVAKTIIAELEQNQGPDKQPRLETYPAPRTNTAEVTSTLQLVAPAAQIRVNATTHQLQIWASPQDQQKIRDTLSKLGASSGNGEQFQLEVYPVRGITPDAATSALTTVLPQIRVTVDATGNKLIVVGSLSEHQAVARLLEQLQAQDDPELATSVRTYPLTRVDSSVTSLLATLVPRAQVSVDSAGTKLVVVATGADHEQIADILDKLRDEDPALKRSMVSYPLGRELDLATVTSLLTTVAPKSQVTADAANHRLLIIATAADHETVAATIQQIAKDAGIELPELRFYPLTRVDSSVTSLLATLVPRAQVTVDSAGTKLVVVATGADHERVANILEQAGDEDPALRRSMVSYPLDRKLDLATVTSLLTTVAPQAQVTADAANHRLLIVATATEHNTVASTIQEVAKDAGIELPELRFYPLVKVDGARAVSLLQTLVPAARLTFDAALRRLTSVATPADQQVIAETLAKLEEVSAEPEEQVLTIYDVSPTQKSRFSSLSASLSPELTQMQVLSDAEPGELAIWATPSEHAVIKNVLGQLDRDVPESLRPKLVSYPILKTDAASLSEVLTPLFPDVRITVDAKANRLLIWARPAEHKTLREALDELDTDAPVEAEFEVMAYPVDSVTPDIASQMILAEIPGLTVISDPTAKTLIVRARSREHTRIAALLDALKGSGLGSRERQVVVYPAIPGTPNAVYNFFSRSVPAASVLVDPATGRMTVWATKAEHEQIRVAVADMTGTGEGALKVSLKTYAIDDALPGPMTNMVNQVAPNAKLATSVDGRHLLVWARESDHALIEDVVSGLVDGLDRADEGSLAVFDVKKIGTAAARRLLAPIVPQVTFSDSPDGNALLAWVEEDDRKRIAAAIEQVMSDKALSGERELKIYDLAAIGGSQAQQVLASTMPAVSFTSTDGGKTAVVWAKPTEHAQIAATIAELAETDPFRDDREMEIYSIRDLGPNVTGLLQTLLPNATIYTGPQPSTIAVMALEEEHRQVIDLLERLKRSRRIRGKSIAAFDIGRADPEAVRQIMQPLVNPDVQITVDAKTRKVFVWTYSDKLKDIEAVVRKITEQQEHENELATRTYQLNLGDADDAQQALQALLPHATLVTDNDRKVLVATATVEEHTLIASVVEQMRGVSGSEGGPQPVTYPLKTADPDSTLLTLRNLFARSPEVLLSVDRPTRTLVAIARPDQQETIRTLIGQLDATDDENRKRTIAAYDIGRADPVAVRQIMQPLVETDVQITVDAKTRKVFVRTFSDKQKEIEAIVNSITRQQDSDDELVTRTYQLNRGEADEAQEALQALMPNATLVTNRNRKVLVATATIEQQELIKSVVEQMRGAFGSDGGLQPVTYPLTTADPDSTLLTLQNLFARTPEVSLSVDRPTRTLVAIARPEQQETIRTLIGQLDQTDAEDRRRTVRVYAMRGTDRASAISIVRTLLEGIDPDATVAFNPQSRQVVVTTRPEGHARVKQMAAELGTSEKREVEVFQLERTDPLTALLAIDGIFDDGRTDVADLPSVQTNDDSQQLIVRGTAEQIGQIREVLVKMGEIALADRSGGTRRVRVIPIDGDFERAMPRIEQLWPRLRKNPLRILRPGGNVPGTDREEAPVPDGGGSETSFFRPQESGFSHLLSLETGSGVKTPTRVGGRVRSEADGPAITGPGLPVGQTRPPRFGVSKPVPGKTGSDRLARRSRSTGTDDSTQTVAFVSEDEPPEGGPLADPSGDAAVPADDATPLAETDPNSVTSRQDAEVPAADLPPVVIIPGPGRVTVASEDIEALNQMESLLRSLLTRPRSVRGRDFTMYALQNASAVTVADTLNEFFKRNSPVSSGNVLVVPDYRLNALIVYAGRADRDRIETLIQTLDSENVPASLASFQQRIVPVKHANATDIARTLKGIYRAQMTAGGGRRSVSIPEGVPASIASVLRQINAASSSPLLTVEVDETTNSLVVMAPTNLLDEVSELVAQLDEAAATSDARLLRIIPLRKTRSTYVMELLQKITD